MTLLQILMDNNDDYYKQFLYQNSCLEMFHLAIIQLLDVYVRNIVNKTQTKRNITQNMPL